LVGGANAGPAIRLVGDATAVGQAFRFSLLPATGLLQDLWLLSRLAALADKDHAGDPWSFVPIFHSESTRI
jgi:hypothetical protein